MIIFKYCINTFYIIIKKELEERPPLYLYTSFLSKGIDLSNNTLTTSYQSRNKSISKNQVNFD